MINSLHLIKDHKDLIRDQKDLIKDKKDQKDPTQDKKDLIKDKKDPTKDKKDQEDPMKENVTKVTKETPEPRTAFQFKIKVRQIPGTTAQQDVQMEDVSHQTFVSATTDSL